MDKEAIIRTIVSNADVYSNVYMKWPDPMLGIWIIMIVRSFFFFFQFFRLTIHSIHIHIHSHSHTIRIEKNKK